MINSFQVCSDHYVTFGEGSSENIGLYRGGKSIQIFVNQLKNKGY